MKPHPFNLKDPVHLLALGFGSGLLKPAPGTWGTLAAVPLYFLIAQLALPVYLAVIALAFLAGIYFCGKTASDIGSHDHGSIVWDEFVGLWITLAAIHTTNNYYLIIAGFLFFRFFDIVKPFPIGLLDKKVHGGFGIMLDDALAGLYALACLLIAEEAWNYYLSGL